MQKSLIALSQSHTQRQNKFHVSIEVSHTCDQNQGLLCATPYWRSSFVTATVAPVDMIWKLAANLVKKGCNVQAKYSSSGISDSCYLPSNLILVG